MANYAWARSGEVRAGGLGDELVLAFGEQVGADRSHMFLCEVVSGAVGPEELMHAVQGERQYRERNE